MHVVESKPGVEIMTHRFRVTRRDRGQENRAELALVEAWCGCGFCPGLVRDQTGGVGSVEALPVGVPLLPASNRRRFPPLERNISRQHLEHLASHSV